MSKNPHVTYEASLGTLADARWSLAVRWWLPKEHPLRASILHPASPWQSRLASGRRQTGVLQEHLMARLGLPMHVTNIGPLLYVRLTVEERVLLTLAGVRWSNFDTELFEMGILNL